MFFIKKNSTGNAKIEFSLYLRLEPVNYFKKFKSI